MLMLAKVGLISLAAGLAACAGSFNATSPHPDDAQTIEQIYARHQTATGQVQQSLPISPKDETRLDGYSRDVYNELAVQFPRLPNPTIIMFVFPHLSAENTPVPGYSTAFQMYEKVQYALPGEILLK